MEYEEKALKALNDVSRSILNALTPHLQNANWTREDLEAAIEATAQTSEVKSGKVLGPLRAALSGSAASPSAIDMMLVIGRDETLARLGGLTT